MPRLLKPSPEELLMGQVDFLITRQPGDNKAPHRDFRLRVPLDSAPALVRAAHERGVSVSAYSRRAVLAFVARDLGIPLADLLAGEPRTRKHGSSPRFSEDPQGEGWEEWAL